MQSRNALEELESQRGGAAVEGRRAPNGRRIIGGRRTANQRSTLRRQTRANSASITDRTSTRNLYTRRSAHAPDALGMWFVGASRPTEIPGGTRPSHNGQEEYCRCQQIRLFVRAYASQGDSKWGIALDKCVGWAQKVTPPFARISKRSRDRPDGCPEDEVSRAGGRGRCWVTVNRETRQPA